MDVKSTFLHGDLHEEFTWNNLLDMFRITLSLFVALINPYMALSNLLERGMPKWIAFSLTLVFLDSSLTLSLYHEIRIPSHRNCSLF